MHIEQIFPLEQLRDEIAGGYVSAREHASEPLTILNYTALAQFEKRWSPLVRACRGLIYNHETNEVVARPPDKFFNLGDNAITNAIDFDEKVEVMDKLDGSFGILYPKSDGTYGIATRGSFHSEQAEHATALWNEKYANYQTHTWFTPYFEIIYPENRIVLNYDGMDDLVLLGARNIQQGYLIGPKEAVSMLWYVPGEAIIDTWAGPVAEVFEFNSISEALHNTGRHNAEGFVIRRGSTLVKIKEVVYLDIHRIRFDMTPRRIWELMSSGGDVDTVLAQLPDEFHADVTDVRDDLIAKYNDIEVDIELAYGRIEDIEDRKEFASYASRQKHASAMFMLRDSKDISKYIWQQIRI